MRQRLADVVRLLVLVGSALAAALGAAVRRIVRGPRVPSWDWSVELMVAALRTSVSRALSRPSGAIGRIEEAGLAAPLPRVLRRLLTVEPGRVGGVSGEWIRRTDGRLVDRVTVLYFHGGGYLVGTPATQRAFTTRLTWALHSETFVPAYRLAPGHRFPAAVDDARAVYLGLLELGVEPGRIVLAGDSAGAGLAAGAVLRLRDEGEPLPGGLLLFSPYADLEHTGASVTANAATDYLPIRENRPNRWYLGDADPRHPWASPIYGDFTGCPPMLVFAGAREVLADDARRLVEAALRDGVDATLHMEPDMIHVWPAILGQHPATLRALARSSEWVSAVVAG